MGTVEEFCNAIFRLLFSKNPIELLQLQKTISSMNKEVKVTAKSIHGEESEGAPFTDAKLEYRKSMSSVSSTSFRRLSQVLLNQETDMDQEISEAQAIIKETVGHSHVLQTRQATLRPSLRLTLRQPMPRRCK